MSIPLQNHPHPHSHMQYQPPHSHPHPSTHRSQIPLSHAHNHPHTLSTTSPQALTPTANTPTYVSNTNLSYPTTSSTLPPPHNVMPSNIPPSMPPNMVSTPNSSAGMRSTYEDLTNALYDHLFEEILFDQCLTVHRTSKCQNWRNDRRLREAHYGEDNETDIFGHTFRNLESSPHFTCENCKRSIGATKFAPHFERCIGKGRTKK
jgi:hypothetical protein